MNNENAKLTKGETMSMSELYDACVDGFMEFIQRKNGIRFESYEDTVIRKMINYIYVIHGTYCFETIREICNIFPNLEEEEAEKYLPAYYDCRDQNEMTVPISKKMIEDAGSLISYNENADGTGYAFIDDPELEQKAGYITVYSEKDVADYITYHSPMDGSRGFEFESEESLNNRLYLELENLRTMNEEPEPQWKAWKRILLDQLASADEEEVENEGDEEPLERETPHFGNNDFCNFILEDGYAQSELDFGDFVDGDGDVYFIEVIHYLSEDRFAWTLIYDEDNVFLSDDKVTEYLGSALVEKVENYMKEHEG